MQFSGLSSLKYSVLCLHYEVHRFDGLWVIEVKRKIYIPCLQYLFVYTRNLYMHLPFIVGIER